MTPLDERLREHYAQLAPQEQRIADFVLDHYNDLASYNSAELARLTGVSKATVSRLFKRLGYDKFKDLREELRTLRQTGMPVADNRDVVQGNTLLARHYQQELANLAQWVSTIDAEQFGQVVRALGTSARVFVLGMRNAHPAALHLRQQLLQIRGQVHLLPQPGQTLAEELVDLGPHDMVVVLAYRRRPRVIRTVLQMLRERQVPTLVMCEPQAQAIIELGTWQLCTPLDSVSAFDSYASANSLINLLANAVLHEHLSQGRDRIHQIAELYEGLDELEQR